MSVFPPQTHTHACSRAGREHLFTELLLQCEIMMARRSPQLNKHAATSILQAWIHTLWRCRGSNSRRKAPKSPAGSRIGDFFWGGGINIDLQSAGMRQAHLTCSCTVLFLLRPSCVEYCAHVEQVRRDEDALTCPETRWTGITTSALGQGGSPTPKTNCKSADGRKIFCALSPPTALSSRIRWKNSK